MLHFISWHKSSLHYASGIIPKMINQFKPFLIIQLRPEDETSNSEFEAILRAGRLSMEDVARVRAEQAWASSNRSSALLRNHCWR